MKFDAMSDKGRVRENNEDSFYIAKDQKCPLFIVADGIGGHKSGEVASNMTVEIIKNNLKNIEDYENIEALEEDFIKAISLANSEVYKKSTEDPELNGMGTTLTLMYFYNDSVLIGHVGDSRTYVISEAGIQQLTEDDTFVNKLVELGEITPTEAANHPKRNIITNAIGTDSRIDISLIQYNYSIGEYLLICTDGLTDMVTNNEILEIINEYKDPKDIKGQLIKRALDAGGKDNITFIIIQI